MDASTMNKGAEFSSDRKYRYALWRVWDKSRPAALFVGLNPSIADEARDDRTVTCCLNYAHKWGYGSLYIGNLFAYCSAYSAHLFRAIDPIGPENDRWLKKLANKADLIVVAWGNDGAYLDRSSAVLRYLPSPQCLKINKTGEPHHPLRLNSNLQPIPFVRT